MTAADETLVEAGHAPTTWRISCLLPDNKVDVVPSGNLGQVGVILYRTNLCRVEFAYRAVENRVDVGSG